MMFHPRAQILVHNQIKNNVPEMELETPTNIKKCETFVAFLSLKRINKYDVEIITANRKIHKDLIQGV